MTATKQLCNDISKDDIKCILDMLRVSLPQIKGRVWFDKKNNLIQIHLGNDVDTIAYCNQNKGML